jgi:hypothetical protein
MKTVVAPPEGWSAVAGEGGRWQAPGGAAWLEVDPLEPLPDDRKGWGDRVLRRGVPSGGALEQVGLANSATELGWPVTVIATVVRDADGNPIEHRLSGFFEFLLYGGVVVFHARDAETFAELRAHIMERVIGQASPDLRGRELARIDELYDIGSG